MKLSFLEILACPECCSDLSLQNEIAEDNEIKSGDLICLQGHRFNIVDFIPVFHQPPKYVKTFDILRTDEIFFLGSTVTQGHSVESLTADEFHRQTGFAPQELCGKRILDAGCGGGRFINYLRDCGAEIVGIDAVEIGLKKCRKRQRERRKAGDSTVHLVQANLFCLPFKKNSFDFIYSLGVLHHTPNPPLCFKGLVDFLKPNGMIAVWVYPKPHFYFSDLIRPFTIRLPFPILKLIAIIVTGLSAPFVKIPKLKPFFFRFRLPWHDRWNWRMHSFLDWYGPDYQFKYTNDEVKRWFEEAILSNIQIMPYETSVRGTKIWDNF